MQLPVIMSAGFAVLLPVSFTKPEAAHVERLNQIVKTVSRGLLVMYHDIIAADTAAGIDRLIVQAVFTGLIHYLHSLLFPMIRKHENRAQRFAVPS